MSPGQFHALPALTQNTAEADGISLLLDVQCLIRNPKQIERIEDLEKTNKK